MSRYFVDFNEMDTKELREEFCRMKGELVTLTNFLVANFKDEIRCRYDVPALGSVEVAMRLLGELKQRRRWTPLLDAARAELEKRRQQVETLRERVAAPGGRLRWGSLADTREQIREIQGGAIQEGGEGMTYAGLLGTPMSYFDRLKGRNEELDGEVSILKSQNKILADFLLVNFSNDIGQGDDIFETAALAAVRLLTELRERRRAPQIELRLLDELDACRRQVEALRTAVVELSDWHIATQKGEPDG